MAKDWKTWLFGERETPVYSQEKDLLRDRLREVAQQQGDINSLRQMNLRRNLSSLQDLTERLSRSPELVFREWQSAATSVLPHEGELGRFTVLPSDPFGGIELTLRKSGSHYKDEVYSRFAGNLRTILRSGAIDALGQISDPGLAEALLPVDSLLPQPALMSKQLFDIRDQSLQSLVQQIGDTIGFNLKVERRGLDTSAPSELLFTQEGTKRPLFAIPEAFGARPGDVSGLVKQGSVLQNIYAPGMFAHLDEAGNIVGEMESFSHFKARRILQAAEAWKSGDWKGTLRSAIDTAVEEADKHLNFVEPGVGVGPGDFSLETIYKSNQLTVFNQEGDLLRGQAQRDFLARHASTLGLTPVSGQSKFGLMDPADLYGGFYPQQDYARKPWQWIRQFRPTDAARSAMASSEFGSEGWNFIDSPFAVREFNSPSGPRLKTLYLSDEQIRTLSEVFNMPIGDGELLVNSQMADQFQVSRRRRIGLSEINKTLTEEFMNRGISLPALREPTRFDPFQFQGVLGKSIDGSLEAVEAGKTLRVMGAMPAIARGSSGATSKTLDLLVEEVLDMENIEKEFGSLKGMARKVDFSKIANISSPYGVSLAESVGLSPSQLGNFGAIGRLSDLDKDPSKKLMQQFSQIMNYADKRRQSGSSISPVAEEMFAGASGHLERIRSLPSSQYETELARLAQQLNLSAQELESITGTTGRAQGVARLHFGGTKEFTGAGKMGTIEPRIFTLLEGGAFSSLSDDVGQELMGRVMATHPERYFLHQGLEKTLQSIHGTATPGSEDIVIRPHELGFEDLDRIRKQDHWIATGVPEVPHVFVPGYDNVPALRPMKIGSGQMVEPSPVSKIFRNIESDVKMLAEKTSGYDADTVLQNFDRNNTGYVSKLAREFAIAGKGTGALTRGSLMGSRFLTAVSDIGTEGPSRFYREIEQLNLPDSNLVVGVPEKHGLKMIREMGDLYGAEAMDDMARRFSAGGVIGGGIARHPFIGSYSMQPVLLKKVNTPDPVLLVPERIKDVTLHLGEEAVKTQITGGILTGMALDKDADIAMAMAFNPKLEKRIRTELTTPGSELMRAMDTGLREADDHAIRMQLLKAKKGSGSSADVTLSQLQSMMADKSKISVVDEEVGRVSAKLQKARAAIVNSSLDATSKSQATGLLEWLEQQPISGKHLSQSRVLSGDFEQQMAMIMRGAGGDERALVSTVQSMVLPEGLSSSERALNEAMLGRGVDITMNGERRFVRGFELEKTASNLSKALNQYVSAGIGKQQSQIDRLTSLKGEQSVSRANLGKLLEANSLSRPSGFSSSARNALSSINRAASEAKATIKPLVRPALIATAVAGVGAALLSGPPPKLTPPPSPGPQEGAPQMRAPMTATMPNNRRDEIENPAPVSQKLGSPSTPNSYPNSGTVMETGGLDRRQSFRASINARNLTPQQRGELGRRLGSNYSGSSINMTVVDSRRSLSRGSLSDMLEDT